MEASGTSQDVMNLECGTSLAELEYTNELQQNERKSEEKKDDESSPSAEMSSEDIIKSIRNSLANDIVTNEVVPMFTSPYETPEAHKAEGQSAIPDKERYVSVPLVYCDQTASNRSLNSVENYIHDVCLPLYGNTHTNTSVTGSQSTAFVAEARQIVAEGCNAKITGKASLDVVLFAGNGATSVVELLIDCLGIKHYASSEETRPVVFVGPYEHHSNLLPWRESGCEIVMIPESAETGNVDIAHLERMLQSPKYGKDRLRMGAFTAASNVTGKVCDTDKISATLHKYGALSFFDYATGAPYLPMNMNPFPTGNYTGSEIATDAMFISPHKMIGGVQTPGILVVKKHLINQTIAPKRSGGGTVFYVTHKHHRFLSNRIERFEGGTPNIVGILRAGLTFLVKRKMANQYLQAVNRMERGSDSIPRSLVDYEFHTTKYVVQRLKKSAPNVIMLGSAEEMEENNHLPIFSFLIKCGERFLHYNYVCALLNDLFGIQSRGGCQCAGPYSQRLLGLTTVEDGEEVPSEINERIEHALLHYKERAELLRPGFTRLSLPFKGLHHDEVEYVIKALEWIAKNGWVFMCQYRCNHRTGEVSCFL
jgi:selenocysteine lyase/cysteine desulfurase